MDIFLGLDIGTSTLSIIAMDIKSGRILSNVFAGNASNLKSKEPDIREQSPVTLYSQVIELIKRTCEELKARKGAIRVIGITCQMHGVLLIDADRKPLTPLITWQDGRCSRSAPDGKSYIRHITDRVGNEVFLRDCGTMPASGFGGMTLFWLRKNNSIPPNVKAVTIGDYIGIRLSDAQPTIDPTNAAGFGIYDIRKRAWHSEIVESLGLPSGLLPEVGGSGEPIGSVTSDVVRSTGLPEGTRICRCVGDNQASFIGSVSNIGREALVNIGTGSQISCPLKGFRTYEGIDTRPLVEDRYIAVGAALCGGEAYAYLRNFISGIGKEFFCSDKSESGLFEGMNELAAKADKNTSLGVNTLFMGTRLDPGVKGKIENIDMSNFNVGSLCRGFLEGIVNELVDFYRICSRDTEISGIVGSGNAVRKNSLFCEIISEKFKRRIRIPAHTEEAAYGAALSAAVGSGFLKSYREAGKILKYQSTKH